MSEQLKDEPKDEPKAIACPRCGHAMVSCELKTNDWKPVVVVPAGSKAGVFEAKGSRIGVLTCYTCGYMEMVALRPENLDPAKPKAKKR